MDELPSNLRERVTGWQTTSSRWNWNPLQWTWHTYEMVVRTGPDLTGRKTLRFTARGPYSKVEVR